LYYAYWTRSVWVFKWSLHIFRVLCFINFWFSHNFCITVTEYSKSIWRVPLSRQAIPWRYLRQYSSETLRPLFSRDYEYTARAVNIKVSFCRTTSYIFVKYAHSNQLAPSTVNSTSDCTLWTFYRSYFMGISVDFEQQV
jgi:hypothetical protein